MNAAILVLAALLFFGKDKIILPGGEVTDELASPRGPFTDPYLRLIAGVEIRTAAATMVAPSTVHTYISVTEEQLEKLPATMFRRL